jgi:oligopeptide transport system substrate-binding protein
MNQIETSDSQSDIAPTMGYLLSTVIFLWSLSAPAAEPSKVFSFHLFSEPTQLDPQLTNSASGTYLVTNLFRGLFRYRSDQGLIPEMAKSCERSALKLRCTLKENIKWSNGESVVAEDFVRGFQHLIDPGNKSPSADVLFTLKNARAIWDGKMPPTELGVTAEDSQHLRFDFAENDFEFEYKLIHPALSPRRAENVYKGAEVTSLLGNGPYQILVWNQGHEVRIIPNKYYDSQAESRPNVNVFFVDDDSTALRLYEAGKLTFLRRLVAAEAPRFETKPGFFQIPMARFDYIGFGPALKDLPQVREALAKSIDFKSFHLLFNSKGLPGCPSLPRSWLDRVPCIKQDLALAKKSLANQTLPKLDWKFGISQLGGEDISRAAEWFQGQWSKNLGVKVPIESMEQAVYLRKLKSQPPALFRKGVGLDRPTCAAALENFIESSPENYIQFKDAVFNQIFKDLQQTKSASKRKELCRKGIERLIAGYWIIPLGEMYFSILASPQFKGWHINEINQLDLTDLRLVQ